MYFGTLKLSIVDLGSMKSDKPSDRCISPLSSSSSSYNTILYNITHDMNSMIAFIVLGFGHHCKLSIVSLHRTLLAKRVIINIGDMISYHIFGAGIINNDSVTIAKFYSQTSSTLTLYLSRARRYMYLL